MLEWPWALTQPLSCLYDVIFTPEQSWNEVSGSQIQPFLGPLFLHLPLSFLPFSPQNLGDFNYSLSNFVGKANESHFLHQYFAKLWWEQFPKPFQRARANTRRWEAKTGLFPGFSYIREGICARWAADGNFKPRATDSFWSVLNSGRPTEDKALEWGYL